MLQKSGERLVSIIYDIKMPCRGAHSQGETIRAKLRVQLRPENSSVVPLLLAARGHAIDVHVVAGVVHRPEAIVRTPECAVCLPFPSKNEIIKACCNLVPMELLSAITNSVFCIARQVIFAVKKCDAYMRMAVMNLVNWGESGIGLLISLTDGTRKAGAAGKGRG